MLGRVAAKMAAVLLPQTVAAAACAPDECYKCVGSTLYACSYTPQCSFSCTAQTKPVACLTGRPLGFSPWC